MQSDSANHRREAWRLASVAAFVGWIVLIVIEFVWEPDWAYDNAWSVAVAVGVMFGLAALAAVACGLRWFTVCGLTFAGALLGWPLLAIHTYALLIITGVVDVS